MDAIITLIIMLVLSGAFDKEKKKKRQEQHQRRVEAEREKMLRYEQEHPEPQERVAEMDAAERRARLQELRKRAAARRAAEEREQAAPPPPARMPQQQSLSFGAPAAEGPPEDCYGAADRHSPLTHRLSPTSQPRPAMPRVAHPQVVLKRPVVPATVSRSSAVGAQLRDPEQLRQAVILSEVLGPPKALRKRR